MIEDKYFIVDDIKAPHFEMCGYVVDENMFLEGDRSYELSFETIGTFWYHESALRRV